MLNDPSTKDTSIKRTFKFAGPNGVRYRGVPRIINILLYVRSSYSIEQALPSSLYRRCLTDAVLN